MALTKCPRCELNYILDGEKYCTICRREIKGEVDKDSVDICPVCNENPVLPGKDLCALCQKELGRADMTSTKTDDNGDVTDDIEINDVSGMDEIAMDLTNDIPARELNDIDRELSLDEALAEEGEQDDKESEEE